MSEELRPFPEHQKKKPEAIPQSEVPVANITPELEQLPERNSEESKTPEGNLVALDPERIRI